MCGTLDDVTRPTARVLQLLELLQASSRTRTIAELAEQLGVHERTVRRYLEHLIDLDVPVRTVRGRYGGVHLGAGARMPPLMLTDVEAVTVLLALQTTAATPGKVAAPAVLEATASKVRRALPTQLRARVQGAIGTGPADRGAGAVVRTEAAEAADAADTAVTVPASRTESDIPRRSLAELLLLLERAVRERRPVQLDHTGARGQRRVRTIHANGVVPRGEHWYVFAIDAESGKQRTFRLDRVAGAHLALGRFDPPNAKAEPASPPGPVEAALRNVPWQHEVLLQVEGTPEAVQRALPAGLATVRPLPRPSAEAHATSTHGTDAEADTRQWSQVTLRAERLDWLPGLLLTLPGAVTVLGPPALRDLVREQGQRLVAASACHV
ncbi:MAG: transcriptional regulator [Humibacillus sp.]|nr:transcriptional regulator [Humibacillus sp.]